MFFFSFLTCIVKTNENDVYNRSIEVACRLRIKYNISTELFVQQKKRINKNKRKRIRLFLINHILPKAIYLVTECLFIVVRQINTKKMFVFLLEFFCT